MAEIPLTRGLVALVDDADLPLVAGRKWHAKPRDAATGGWYAATKDRRRNIYMHRLLVPGAPRIDHKNGNGLDNRRSTGNLRAATGTQNNANRMKISGTSSRYKGVCRERGRKGWYAAIQHDDRKRRLGRFETEEAAALAYNAAALEVWGEYARLNEVPR